jgi:pimeloyl-ACP methyl ester carboxylesterase
MGDPRQEPIDPAAQVLQLPDGRQLGFAEWGSSDGDLVVVDFHGGPGCRLAIAADPTEFEARNVRWISTDRPGIGLSSPHPDRRVSDFTNDIACLVDHLGIDDFIALGWSMGGPYAAACAALLRPRVRGVALIAPAPVGLDADGGAERMGKAWAWQLARDEPWQLVNIYTRLGLEARRNPASAVELFSLGLSPPELEAMGRPDVQTEFLATIVEATRQGAIGLVDDLRVEMQPWGFDPRTIDRPGFVWQGDDDTFSTPAMAEQWGEAVAGLEVRILHGEGHLFPFSWTNELLEALDDLG